MLSFALLTLEARSRVDGEQRAGQYRCESHDEGDPDHHGLANSAMTKRSVIAFDTTTLARHMFGSFGSEDHSLQENQHAVRVRSRSPVDPVRT